METKGSQGSDRYRIRVDETIDRRFGEWVGDLTMIPQENGNTVLVCSFPDQAALRGFLDQLWNLNITIINVERIENEG